MAVVFETSLGDFVVDLYHAEEPEATLNFLKLCKLKRYNDAHFFHIEPGFVARVCDRFSNHVSPGTGIYELTSLKPPTKRRDNLRITHAKAGVLSLPNNGTGSQFFLTLVAGLDYLDNTHTAIGEIAEGQNILRALASVDVSTTTHIPFRSVRVRHTIVLHDPFKDPPGFPTPPASPPPNQEPPSGFLPSDEERDGVGRLSESELRALEAAQEARSRAEVLEMIGDLPDADVRPPDNVLFVCRLNPVTEADDLEIIFSRFGECRADIIRDHRTKDSLCYAFVEFGSAAACEKAYHKMDKALVDDRRIRVDFSQSVSRLWNAHRRNKAKK